MNEPVIDRLEISVCAIAPNGPDRVACREHFCIRAAEFEMRRKYIHPDVSLPKAAQMFYCSPHLDAALRNTATFFANDVHVLRRERADRAIVDVEAAS
jgi:hypothetical protein